MWSVKCGVWSVQWVKCRVWSVECRGWSEECKVWSVQWVKCSVGSVLATQNDDRDLRNVDQQKLSKRKGFAASPIDTAR